MIYFDPGPEVQTEAQSCGCRFVKHRSGLMRTDCCLPHAIDDVRKELELWRKESREGLAKIAERCAPLPRHWRPSSLRLDLRRLWRYLLGWNVR